MSTTKGNSESQIDIADWAFTLRLEQMMHHEPDVHSRALDRDIIYEAIEEGKRYPDRGGEGNALCEHTVAGITFHVIVDVGQREVITAYPHDFDRFTAITSNRWTRHIIEGIEQRIEEAKRHHR